MTEITTDPAKAIQAIDKTSVHRICSGQVVLNLATAIKELVENSIDVGATNIEIRLKDYGSELVEVIDNGSGVEEENFAGLALKHHTSKLKDFSDLVNVDTFGFRGEALSSLCALSKLTIITCHETVTVGTKLEFDNHGNIRRQIPCPRQRGTTVSLENLFSTLPVRHKEFQRNLKREFTKAIQVLNAYCIISTGIRITCTNQIGKGKKNIVVNTVGNLNVLDNITNIYGTKQTQGLLNTAQTSPTEETCTEYGINDQQGTKHLFNITGYVSSSEHGQGRSASDRQFYFINKRPCDPQKISRLVNEVYHMYNRHQYPFIMMDISLAKDSVDVNVTPDKRQIFVQQEKLLLATIKSSLMKIFEPRSALYKIKQTVSNQKSGNLTSLFSRKSPMKPQSSCPELPSQKIIPTSLANLKRRFSSTFAKHEDINDIPDTHSKQRRLDSFIISKQSMMDDSSHGEHTLSLEGNDLSNKSMESQKSGVNNAETVILLTDAQDKANFENTTDTHVILECAGNSVPSGDENCEHRLNHINDLTVESGTISEHLHTNSLTLENQQDILPDKYKVIEEGQTDISFNKHIAVTQLNSLSKFSQNLSLSQFSVLGRSPTVIINSASTVKSLQQFRRGSSHEITEKCENHECVSTSRKIGEHDELIGERMGLNCPLDDGIAKSADSGRSHIADGVAEEMCEDVKITSVEYDAAEIYTRKETKINFSMEHLKQSLQRRKDSADSRYCRSFRARIKPGDNQAAEDELKREISKDMFDKMEILGQFNLGFIISRLGQDLFIIDQHASDEKYNFEQLQKHTVIQSLRLIQPQRLELTAANECILLDNLEIFHGNGFDFSIDEHAPSTRKVSLVTMPVSKNWTFGKDDIEELVFMLSDSPGVMCRPSRIRQMFASRSCRKSVMIGTALNKAEMKKLIQHMGQLDQPWNCPHGRPTMRHLINLDMLSV